MDGRDIRMAPPDDTDDHTSAFTAHEIARAVANGSVSASAVLAAFVERIDTLDPVLSAFCTLSYDVAREQSADIDRRISKGERVGPLAGVPVAVKDLIPTRGIRTTYGSLLYEHHVPESDDVVVERLRAADALIIGKTNASEFGYGPVSHNPVFPPTRNPWDTSLSPGGSSSGSAAAVAARMVPLAVGSDGGGSVRVPAALCGVYGFKPSFGRIPVYPSCRDERWPGVSGWETLEHFGPIATCIRDIRLFMSVAAGPDSRDRHSIPSCDCDWLGERTLSAGRIAYSGDLGFARCEPEIDAIARDALTVLTADGWQLSEQAPYLPDAQKAFEAIVASETDRAGIARMAADRGVDLSRSLREVLAGRWSAEEFSAAVAFRKKLARLLAEFFVDHDILATPATAAVAFPVGQDGPATIAGTAAAASAWTPFSSYANLVGSPAITVPVGLTRAGLPVGLQLMGRHLDDMRVLGVAERFEELMPFRHLPSNLYQGAA
jgi:aspartyl-tRNA(Asn)/glutamyl-tRNA(Gln) amidotransferase subunit A